MKKFFKKNFFCQSYPIVKVPDGRTDGRTHARRDGQDQLHNIEFAEDFGEFKKNFSKILNSSELPCSSKLGRNLTWPPMGGGRAKLIKS